jgi:hypothetical protein
MANVKIHEPNGRMIEISDISIEELKQLVSTNGHVNSNGHVRSTSQHTSKVKFNLNSEREPDYPAFRANLSDRAKTFLHILRTHPDGISADSLSELMHFKSSTQIGGVTGGGISKLISRFHIADRQIYTKEVLRENGMRKVIFRPGPAIEKVS